MKSEPGSVNRNLNNQDLKQQESSKASDSLENLFSLLDELVEEDKVETNNQLEEKQTATANLNLQEQSAIATKGDSNQEQAASELSANSWSKIDLDSAKNKSILSSSVRKARMIERKIFDSQSKTDVEPLSNSRELEKKVVSSDHKPIKKNYQNTLNTIEESFLNLDSVNAEEITKTYASQQWIIEKERQINELANSVDTLIPLVVELSKVQDNNSEEYILKAIVPIIDRIIQQRSVEDRQKMADAIANILPDAIKHEIINAPESIGKAIAPEIALSIKEQTKLNEGAIAQAMGSEMGKAIKTQIEMERDAMVDALYPVIGSTISKYMGEVVASINEKVDAALSPQGIQRKIRAKIQGVSEAELILQESVPSSIRAIFLIHNNSGLVIRELQPHTESPLESDLLAGMLTAIRSFANDCIASNSELDEIDYGNFRILFETAGYCYLAVVVQGEPIRQFRDRMRTIFSQIVLKYGDAIEDYQGDPATVPQAIEPLLEELVYQSSKADHRKPPKALYWLTAIILSGIVVPWGIVKYRGVVADRIEQTVATELNATPELSVYRLNPEVKKGKLTLTGRVPSTYLKNLATSVSQQIAGDRNLELNNQIVAVNVPVDPTITAQEVARTTKLLNQQSSVLIETQYNKNNQTVTIDGLILEPEAQQKLLTNFTSIPGVENAIFVIEQELPQLKTRIYFDSNSSEFSMVADSAKMTEIKQFLNRYPLIKLRIIGHSDRRGETENNIKLARARANIVYQQIVAQGIDPNRLEKVAFAEPPPNTSPDRPLWLSRCVRFESFIAQK